MTPTDWDDWDDDDDGWDDDGAGDEFVAKWDRRTNGILLFLAGALFGAVVLPLLPA